jgi:hypothetical protein
MRPALLLWAGVVSAQTTLVIDRPLPPPPWALAQRAVLRASSEAAREFAARYTDPQGRFLCVERWGGNDGPDDVMETFHNWPLLYALGGDEPILALYRKIWEAHLQQYTRARAPGIEMAAHGMYYQEFITAFDWEHNGEGLQAFYHYGLARPDDLLYRQRAARFAGLYLGPPNYDPQHKIIRSLHNGSRGPKLTPATVEDWGGLAEPGTDRHSRYKTAANIRGDHPLNLCATTLGMNAYLLTGEERYRSWLLEYGGAWRERLEANGGNAPTNIGLDGRIGGEWGGKWYGGVFGWDFWPESASRNYYMRGLRLAFGEAFLLTQDQRFADALRRQIDNLYAAKKVENGRILLPNKYGDKGWYGHTPNQHFDVQRDIYLWTMRPSDLERIRDDEWIAYLDGRNPDYPFRAFQRELEGIRRRVQGFRQDPSTPDTRSSDHAQRWNPVATTALVNLTLGANDPGTSGNILHSRVRYFDPVRRRAGLPPDVAALVEKVRPEEIVLTLVNTNQVESRVLVVQMGAYGEHQAVRAGAPHFQVRLAPGAGDTLAIPMKRYAHRPALGFPWDR